jgi:hypothetical protein
MALSIGGSEAKKRHRGKIKYRPSPVKYAENGMGNRPFPALTPARATIM